MIVGKLSLYPIKLKIRNIKYRSVAKVIDIKLNYMDYFKIYKERLNFYTKLSFYDGLKLTPQIIRIITNKTYTILISMQFFIINEKIIKLHIKAIKNR